MIWGGPVSSGHPVANVSVTFAAMFVVLFFLSIAGRPHTWDGSPEGPVASGPPDGLEPARGRRTAPVFGSTGIVLVLRARWLLLHRHRLRTTTPERDQSL